jgi:hypothetical protein
VACAGEYLPASDVFSFGVVVLELLTGAPPVDPAQRPANLYARMRARLPGQAEAVADPVAGWAALPGGGAAARGLGALAARCVVAAGSGRPSFTEVGDWWMLGMGGGWRVGFGVGVGGNTLTHKHMHTCKHSY